VNLNHFRLLRVVGKGAFGKVRIVERKDSGLTFALKYIRKDEGMSTKTLFLSHLLPKGIGRSASEPVRVVDELQWFVRKACETSSENGEC